MNVNRRTKLNLIPIGLLIAIIIGSVFVFTANNSMSVEQTVQALPVTINAWVTGETSGDIEGGSTEAGKEGSIECLSYSHSIVSPRDAASGLPTGKRQHKPFTIVKEVDKATPLLMNAIINNEKLDIIFRFYSPENVNYYTITLEGAYVASFSQSYSSMGGEPAPPQEVISFVYMSITWCWELDGTTAFDDWEDPVV